MSEPAEEAAYDPIGVVDKWLPVWDELRVFEPVDDGSRPRAYVVDMFPYPSGDLHMGHAEAFSIGDAVARFSRARGNDVLHPIGWDSFGLPAENAALARNLDPRDWTYANIEVQSEGFRRLGISVDWRTRLHTSDPDLLPLDAVAVPAAVRAGPGLPQVGAGQLVPEGPDRARQRAGDPGSLRALRHRGHEEEPDPVVLPDHRVRRAAAGRHGRVGGCLADAGPDDAAQLDRPLDRRLRRLHRSSAATSRCGCSRPARTRCSARRSSSSRPTRTLADELCAPELREGFSAYLAEVRRVHRHRAAGRGSGQDRRAAGSGGDQPGQRRADPGVGGGLRAGRLRHGRDHGRAGARPARPGLRAGLRPAGPRGGRHRGAGPGGDRDRDERRRAAGQQREVRRAADGRGDRRRSPPTWRRPARANSRDLPAARLAGVAAALLGLPDPDRALPGVRRGAGARRPAAGRAADRGLRAAADRWAVAAVLGGWTG